MDLETGFIDEKVFQVRHIRDTKQGAKELRDERDIYETLANVAARRKRACILAIIPTDVVEAAVKQCEITMSAKLEINDDYIKTVLDSFAQVGVTKEMLEKRIQRKIEALTPALAMQLRKIRTSIKDEMSAPGDWFDMGAPATGAATPPEKQGATANVANDLKARREKKAADKPAEAAKPPANAPVDPGTGEILTPESLKTELMGCTTQAQTQAVLDKIMKLPATPERAALMTEWNAAVMRVQAATPAPAAAPAPTQAPAAAPQPAQPAAQVPGEKPDGDAAEFEKAMRAMADAKDKDALDLAADRAVSFKWPEELRAQLNKRYNEQLDKFEGG
jgi:hypothetical protein